MFTGTINVNTSDIVKQMDEKSQQIREIFGKNLKKIRKAKKMTQDDISSKIGVQRNTISMYESGNSMPSETVIQKIVIVLDISRDKLFDYVSDYDFSNDQPNELNESELKSNSSQTDNLLTYINQLESDKIFPNKVIAKLKSLAMILYQEKSEDKEEIVKQMKKYEALRELIKKEMNLKF